MLEQFTDTLGRNLATVLTLAVIVGGAAAVILFVRARRRHVDGIRRRLTGEMKLPGRVKEVLAQAMNANVAEVGAIGAVSFVDVAWQYSMADPAIWDHFNGPAADHITDALQNLDVVKASFADHSLVPLWDNVVDFLRGVEASQAFHDIADKLPLIHDSHAIVLESKGASLVDSLATGATAADVVDAKSAAADTGLGVHIPLVTIGFATYRAWRRAQKGAALPRNVEFATIEVATRTTGGLVGGKVGGVVGTAVVPGVGTIVGMVAGAMAGAIGGAALGEVFKRRHVEKATEQLNDSLATLGETYIEDDAKFDLMIDVFRDHEARYVRNLRETKRRARRYAAAPWRTVWPDEKMILLNETVRLAEQRLGSVKAGTVEATDRLRFMRETGQRREMGVMLWSNPALCEEIVCDVELVGAVETANDRLRRELAQLGLNAEVAAA